MELNDAMRTTFAAREYTDDHLPDEVLYETLDNARFAPSGGNRQGNHVIVVRDPETRAQLAALAEPAARRYRAQIEAGEHAWSAVAPTKLSAETIANTPVLPMLTEPYKQASVVLVVVVDLKVVAATDQHLDRVGIIGGASVYPFVWNLLMAARQAGFGGTITTLAIAEEPKLQALFNIPSDYAVCALVPLGRPVRQLTRLRRRPVEELATRERFDGAPFTRG